MVTVTYNIFAYVSVVTTPLGWWVVDQQPVWHCCARGEAAVGEVHSHPVYHLPRNRAVSSTGDGRQRR